MLELKHSGLPLYINEQDYMMALSGQLKLGGYARKNTDKMIGLLENEANLKPDDPFYDVYRDIYFPEDKALLEKNHYQYDITIVMPGTVNGELKKTSGHFHGWNIEHTNTYGEVYEVLKGTALYVLQKSPNFDADNPGDVQIDDMILVTVHEGQIFLVPPNYGHASINIGEGPLIFSNLAYQKCPVLYEAVKFHHGMAVYVSREDGKISIQMNRYYKNLPEIKYATLKENPHLGVVKGSPVYVSYQKDPDAFEFLGHPDDYVDEIMSMLEYHNELIM